MMNLLYILILAAAVAAASTIGPLIVPRSLHDDLSPFALCVERHVTGTVFENCQEALPRVLVSSAIRLSEVLAAVNNQIRNRRLDSVVSLQELLQSGIGERGVKLAEEGGGADAETRIPTALPGSIPSIVVTTRPVNVDTLSNGDLLRVPEGPPIILVAIAPLQSEKLAGKWREALAPVDTSNRFTILPLDYLEASSVLVKELRLLVETTPVWAAWALEETRYTTPQPNNERSWTTTTFTHKPVISHAEYYITGAGVAAAVGGVIVLVSTSLGTSAAAERRAPPAPSEVSIDW